MSQTLKPLTAANKLGIHLPSAPEEFQRSSLTRDELEQLRADPPEWLQELRRNGPFPRDVVARKLGVSNSGLSRAEISDALTQQQIDALLADPPPWLVRERESFAAVVADEKRRKAAPPQQ